MSNNLFLVGTVHGHGTYVSTGQRPAGNAYQYQSNLQGSSSSAPGNQYFRLSPDGSYDFGYDTGSGAYKNEQKNAGGQLVGKYGHSSPDGSYTNVQYEAQSSGSGNQASSYRGSYSSGDGDGYESGSGTYQAVQYGHTLPVQPGRSSETAQTTYDRKPDGSYSFNVQSRDQSRVESGTADGQVQGGYSFVGDDGVQRSVSYTAGQQGFQASGDHIPKDSNTPGYASTSNAQRGYSASSAAYAGSTSGLVAPAVQTYAQRVAQSSPSGSYNSGYQQTSTHYRSENRGYGAGQGVRGQHQGYVSTSNYRAGGGGVVGLANSNLAAPSYGTYKGAAGTSGHVYNSGGGYYDQQQSANPKPFSFSYNAGDHGRQESQDANGVVRGSYVVNAADGTQKELTYQADDDGFRIVDEKVVGSAAGSYSGAAAGTGSYATSGSGYGSGVGAATSGGYVQAGRTAYGGGGGGSYSSGQKYKQKSIHSGGTAY